MGKGSTLRNCGRKFRKVINPHVFTILNILTGGFFRFIARLKRNHDKICSAYGLYVTPTWKDLRLPTQPLCLRLMLGAVMTEEPPSSAVTITRNSAATSCSIVSRGVTGRHAAAPSSSPSRVTSSLFPARVRAADWCGAGQGREISGETRGRGGSSAWRWSAAVSSLYTSAALECSVFGQCLGAVVTSY